MNRPSRPTSTKFSPRSAASDTLSVPHRFRGIARSSIQGLRSKAKKTTIASVAGRATRLTTSRRLATNRGMESKTLAVLVVVAFSGVGVLGDYFLKLASEE